MFVWEVIPQNPLVSSMHADDTTAAPSSVLETATSASCSQLMDHGVESVHPVALLAEGFET